MLYGLLLRLSRRGERWQVSEVRWQVQIPSDRRGAMQMRTSRIRTATVVSIIVAALTTAAAQRTPQSGAKRSQPTSASAGHHTFDASCAACHGLDGRGGERAPDIATRPEITRLSDQDLLKVLRAGIPEKGMPAFAGLGSAKLQALVSYVRTLQGKDTATSIARGNAAQGKELYWGRAGCSGCHIMNGAGGFLGGDLSNYGESHSLSEIRAAIVEPQKTTGPGGRAAEVTTRDGEMYSGVVRNEDNFSLQLQSADGVFHLWSKSDLGRVSYQQEPLMPGDYGTKLRAPELDALAAYLGGIAPRKQQRREASPN
jgi:cytochrome c oxidase cbb3-type subunit III